MLKIALLMAINDIDKICIEKTTIIIKTISYINILNLNSFQITQQPFHCFTGTTFEHFWILYISFLHKYLVLTFNVDLTLNSLKVPKYLRKKYFHVDLNFRPYRPLTVP